MVPFYRLQGIQCCNNQGSIPYSNRWWTLGWATWSNYLFQTWSPIRLPPDTNVHRRHTQDGFPYTWRSLRIHGNAVWLIKCYIYFSSFNEFHFPSILTIICLIFFMIYLCIVLLYTLTSPIWSLFSNFCQQTTCGWNSANAHLANPRLITWDTLSQVKASQWTLLKSRQSSIGLNQLQSKAFEDFWDWPGITGSLSIIMGW